MSLVDEVLATEAMKDDARVAEHEAEERVEELEKRIHPLFEGTSKSTPVVFIASFNACPNPHQPDAKPDVKPMKYHVWSYYSFAPPRGCIVYKAGGYSVDNPFHKLQILEYLLSYA